MTTRTSIGSSDGLWDREARRLCDLAAAVGLELDDEELFLRDTRELLALRGSLRDLVARALKPLGHSSCSSS